MSELETAYCVDGLPRLIPHRTSPSPQSRVERARAFGESSTAQFRSPPCPMDVSVGPTAHTLSPHHPLSSSPFDTPLFVSHHTSRLVERFQDCWRRQRIQG